METIRPEIAQRAARAKLIGEAVAKIYAAKGGDLLDKQIRNCEHILDASILCREFELKRAREQGITTREKGERPVISPSESRLNSDKLDRFVERRDDMMREARMRVNEALNAAQPQNDEEFKAALQSAIDAEPEPAKPQEQSARPLMSDGKNVYEVPDIQAIYKVFNPEERRQFKQALDTRDVKTMEKLMERFPPKVKEAMLQMTMAA